MRAYKLFIAFILLAVSASAHAWNWPWEDPVKQTFSFSREIPGSAFPYGDTTTTRKVTFEINFTEKNRLYVRPRLTNPDRYFVSSFGTYDRNKPVEVKARTPRLFGLYSSRATFEDVWADNDRLFVLVKTKGKRFENKDIIELSFTLDAPSLAPRPVLSTRGKVVSTVLGLTIIASATSPGPHFPMFWASAFVGSVSYGVGHGLRVIMDEARKSSRVSVAPIPSGENFDQMYRDYLARNAVPNIAKKNKKKATTCEASVNPEAQVTSEAPLSETPIAQTIDDASSAGTSNLRGADPTGPASQAGNIANPTTVDNFGGSEGAGTGPGGPSGPDGSGTF